MVLSDVFQSTLPLRGATGQVQRASANGREHISIHTPLAGSDLETGFVILRILISIHTPLAGSDANLQMLIPRIRISIHTPLAGSDQVLFPEPGSPLNFNPHSPCGERQFKLAYPLSYDKFQSTLPLRGATVGLLFDGVVRRISIHTPLAGSDLLLHAPKCKVNISIHTPLAGSDFYLREIGASTIISIHTPLAGSDPDFWRMLWRRTNFNPHSPCGERPQK